MLQESCINWGQMMCEYFNVREYAWKDNAPIYLVEEAKTDQEHTQFEFVGVRYYLCEKCYLSYLEIDKDFFKFTEVIHYSKELNLDEVPAFAVTSKRFVSLRECKKVVNENLKLFRFDVGQLKEQQTMLKQLSEADYQRLLEEFNDSPLKINGREAMNISLAERLKIIDLLLEHLTK
ncbi:hypothetical protein [Mesoplasma seiffertii]|uniref:hypothetical protein n=1 Tax=Mesoplasma seiffertii TaxID=28224 RepID=UPI000479F106|nr:hypothetical protein [Mesoplasma seiffertii]